MPKKSQKANNRKNKNQSQTLRELVLKEEGQEYAYVTRLLGDRRLTCMCEDGKERLGIIRGAMCKKVWIVVDDLILIGLRDFQKEKADVIHKYTPDEVRKLKKLGQVGENSRTKREEVKEDELDEEEAFVFEDL